MSCVEEADQDGRLLARVAQGDESAFAELYDRWASRLFALVLQIVVDRAQSEEVLQDVFWQVWTTAASYEAERGSARAWLVTLARRRAIDRVRSSQAARDREARHHGDYPDFDSTLDAIEERLEGERVRRALEQVGEPHASTIKLAYFTGLTHAQIAERMRVPLGTVKSRIRDGIDKLRVEMGVTR